MKKTAIPVASETTGAAILKISGSVWNKLMRAGSLDPDASSICLLTEVDTTELCSAAELMSLVQSANTQAKGHDTIHAALLKAGFNPSQIDFNALIQAILSIIAAFGKNQPANAKKRK